MRGRWTSALHPLLLPFAAGYLALVVVYASFTAEDAYIVYRYAENWVRGDGLVFNPGEPINALTSPLHAMLCAALYAGVGNTAEPARALGALAVVAACLFALASRREPPAVQTLFAAFALLSPFVALWTVGGLETPFLLAAVTVAPPLAERCTRENGSSARVGLSLCLGLAFLTRFDSALFSLPLLASVAWRDVRRPRVVAPLAALVLPGLVLALAWLGWSRIHYHDFLPTSFYHKRPGLEALDTNLIYTLQFALFSGLALLAAFAAWTRRRRDGHRTLPRVSAASVGTGLGLLAVLGYGLGAATSHMMFSYRLFVPYLPSAVLLLLGLAGRPVASQQWPRRWLLATAAVVSAQLALAVWIERRSINPGWVGEYVQVSRRGYVEFMNTLERQAEAIRVHWAGTGAVRPPRVFVYAAGLVPYRLPEAYVMDGGLVSYRHAYDGNDLVPPLPTSADYVLTLHPHLGRLSRQLEEQPERFEPVLALRQHFVGTEQSFAVWYNASPTRWRLPARVDAPADLRHAQLEGKDLRGVRLRDADLTQARLAGADLVGADLSGARLTRADLRGAQLDATMLRGADLRGANLTGALGLTQQQLDAACGDASTALPTGLAVPRCRE